MKSESVIQVNNLSYSYPKSDWKLSIPSFTLQKGEKIFLYGPSGTGKTTFLKLITGILSPQLGRVDLFGESFSNLSQRKRDRIRGINIGQIFQTFNLIPYLSVKDNILLNSLLHKKRYKKTTPLEQTLPPLLKTLGLSEEHHKKASEMSVGGQQRIALARALLGRPKLIIADEPTSSLDEERTNAFMELLMSESEKHQCAILFVSHDSRLKSYFQKSTSLSELQGELQRSESSC